MAPKAQKPPAFQFYPKDWDTDENVIPMTYEEEGVYWALCRRYWLAGNTLPSDLDTLRGLLKGRPPLKKMESLWKAIGRCFVVTDGRLSHKKLDALREEQQVNKKKRQDAANERWERERGGKQPAAEQMQSSPDADAMQCSASSSASSTSSAGSAGPTKRQAVQGSGAFGAGTLPRDHVRHGYCGPGYRLCLNQWEFTELAKQFGGTDPAAARAAIEAFVDKLVQALGEDQSPGGFKAIEKEFQVYLRGIGRLSDGPRLREAAPTLVNSQHDQVLRDIAEGKFARRG